jgi:glycosyltransferase involved in cell wall biosynthesis
MKRKKLISIIIPVYNEEENIYPIYETVLNDIIQKENTYDFEIIFTDNHSIDKTFEKLSELYNKDSRVRVFRFTRNFGYQRSILTGYLQSRGEAIIQLDCDLQDPPLIILKFIRDWECGYDVVYGVRRRRKENFIINKSRYFFYRLINYLSEEDLPLDAGDFRLIDRKIINEIKKFEDAQPYLRGMIASMGFKQKGIVYDRNERLRGKSKFKLRDLIILAIDGILNHSILPLRLSTFFGLGISIITIIAIIFYATGKLILGYNWPAGFTTLSIMVLFGVGVNSLFLGIIGEYIGRIYQQVKKRPLVIIEECLDVENINK